MRQRRVLRRSQGHRGERHRQGHVSERPCKALIANPAKYVGDIAEDSAKDLYAMSERPTQPQVCEYAIEGRTFVVRDEGMLKVVGNVLCSGLARRADRP